MDPSDIVVPLVTGAVAGGVVAIVAQMLQGRRDHKRWKQRTRLDASVQFMAAADRYMGTVLDPKPSTEEYEEIVETWQRAIATVEVLGPPAVSSAASAYRTALQSSHSEGGRHPLYERERIAARQAYVAAVRKATGLN